MDHTASEGSDRRTAPGADVRLREATAADQAALWLGLYYAAHMDRTPGAAPADVLREPTVQRYVRDWGRPGDLAVLAESAAGELLGVVWLRLHVGAERERPEFVDAETPELGIAVLPAWQGQGIGARLLARAIEGARDRYPAIVLTVRAGSTARRLYERLGFVAVGTIANRVGGVSDKMLLRLAAAPPRRLPPERGS